MSGHWLAPHCILTCMVQIEELLKEVMVSYDSETFLESALHQLKTLFDGLKDFKQEVHIITLFACC